MVVRGKKVKKCEGESDEGRKRLCRFCPRSHKSFCNDDEKSGWMTEEDANMEMEFGLSGGKGLSLHYTFNTLSPLERKKASKAV